MPMTLTKKSRLSCGLGLNSSTWARCARSKDRMVGFTVTSAPQRIIPRPRPVHEAGREITARRGFPRGHLVRSWAPAMSHHLSLDEYRADTSGHFALKDHKPDSLPRGMTKERAEEHLAAAHARMRERQEKLYAQDQWSLLVILQGMDAAGKDSAIEHVFIGLNPQSCEVHAFKIPSDEE